MNTINDNVLEFIKKIIETNERYNASDIIADIVETVVNEIMSIHADQLCDDLGVSRNGYRERKLNTLIGTINLKIPKLRKMNYYPNFLLEKYSRSDRALVACVSDMYEKGMSVRKIEDHFEGLNIQGLSKSTISNMCTYLDEDVAYLRDRDLGNTSWPYVWLDATYIRCRGEKHVESMAFVTAIGVNEDGYRQFLGFSIIDTESYTGWYGFLDQLKKRGLSGVQCVVSDAHAGLKRACLELFEGASWQRCIVHLERDVIACATNRKQRKLIAKLLHEVFAEDNPDLVRELYRQAGDMIHAINNRAGKLFLEAENEALCYLDFPRQHHIRLRTNNVQERTNREIKRRSDSVQIFPSVTSMERLIGSVLVDIDEKWSLKRYMSHENMQLCFEAFTRPKSSYTEEEISNRARIMLELVKEEVLEGFRRVA